LDADLARAGRRHVDLLVRQDLWATVIVYAHRRDHRLLPWVSPGNARDHRKLRPRGKLVVLGRLLISLLFPQKADIHGPDRNVRLVPKADLSRNGRLAYPHRDQETSMVPR